METPVGRDFFPAISPIFELLSLDASTVPGAALGFNHGALACDPDGHAMQFVGR